MVRFASGSKNFLGSLSQELSLALDSKKGCILKNSGKLFNFMYNSVSAKEYLERKYNKFQKAFKVIGAVA